MSFQKFPFSLKWHITPSDQVSEGENELRGSPDSPAHSLPKCRPLDRFDTLFCACYTLHELQCRLHLPGRMTMALKSVLVELQLNTSDGRRVMEAALSLAKNGFIVDRDYDPVPLRSRRRPGMGPEDRVFVVRGQVKEAHLRDLESAAHVVNVWDDGPIEAFNDAFDEEAPLAF